MHTSGILTGRVGERLYGVTVVAFLFRLRSVLRELKENCLERCYQDLGFARFLLIKEVKISSCLLYAILVRTHALMVEANILWHHHHYCQSEPFAGTDMAEDY